jgi:hypothetical protein
MVTEFSLLVAGGAVAAASVAMVLRWQHDFPRGPAPIVPRPFDDQPHTLTMVGPDGRLNPLHYETFPDYRAALARQHKLARLGRASVVTHVESGEVRVDVAGMLGPFGRIYY